MYYQKICLIVLLTVLVLSSSGLAENTAVDLETSFSEAFRRQLQFKVDFGGHWLYQIRLPADLRDTPKASMVELDSGFTASLGVGFSLAPFPTHKFLKHVHGGYKIAMMGYGHGYRTGIFANQRYDDNQWAYTYTKIKEIWPWQEVQVFWRKTFYEDRRHERHYYDRKLKKLVNYPLEEKWNLDFGLKRVWLDIEVDQGWDTYGREVSMRRTKGQGKGYGLFIAAQLGAWDWNGHTSLAIRADWEKVNLDFNQFGKGGLEGLGFLAYLVCRP